MFYRTGHCYAAVIYTMIRMETCNVLFALSHFLILIEEKNWNNRTLSFFLFSWYREANDTRGKI